MFLFLLLAIVVVWAAGLVRVALWAFSLDYKSRAENFEPFAFRSREGWIPFQTCVLAMAKAASYCSGVPGGGQLASCCGDEPWPLNGQESGFGLVRFVSASWSKRLKVAVASAAVVLPKACHTAGWLAHGRAKQCDEVESWLLSMAR